MGIAVQVSFDAADAPRLAEFWAIVLDYQPQPPPPGYDSWEAWASAAGIPEEETTNYGALIDPAGQGPRFFFQNVPEATCV